MEKRQSYIIAKEIRTKNIIHRNIGLPFDSIVHHLLSYRNKKCDAIYFPTLLYGRTPLRIFCFISLILEYLITVQ